MTRKPTKSSEQRHHRGAGIVASEAVDAVVDLSGFEGVEGPAFGRAHGVDVAIEEQSGFMRIEPRRYGVDIVCHTLGGEPPLVHSCLQELSHSRFVATHRGHCYHIAEQLHGIVVYFVDIHHCVVSIFMGCRVLIAGGAEWGLLFGCIHFAREHEIENNSQDENHSHTVLGEHGLHNLRENIEHARALSEAEANT